MVTIDVEVECEHCGHKFVTKVEIDESEIEDWTKDDRDEDDHPCYNEGMD